MHVAAEEKIAEASLNVLGRDKSGWTALHVAADSGSLKAAKELLAEAELLQIVTSLVEAVIECDDRTALHLAAKQGHEDIVGLLHAYSSDIFLAKINEMVWSPLFLAALGGHVKVVEALLARSPACLERSTHWVGSTALRAAAGGGHVQLVEVLLAHKPELLEREGSHALEQAAREGRDGVVELLLAKDWCYNPLRPYHGALELAAHYGHVRVVELLLQRPTFPVGVALQAAVSACQARVVDLLLTLRPELLNETMLGFTVEALRRRDREVLRILVLHMAHIACLETLEIIINGLLQSDHLLAVLKDQCDELLDVLLEFQPLLQHKPNSNSLLSVVAGYSNVKNVEKVLTLQPEALRGGRYGPFVKAYIKDNEEVMKFLAWKLPINDSAWRFSQGLVPMFTSLFNEVTEPLRLTLPKELFGIVSSYIIAEKGSKEDPDEDEDEDQPPKKKLHV